MSTFEIIDYLIGGLTLSIILLSFFWDSFKVIYFLWGLVICQTARSIFEAAQHDWIFLMFHSSSLILFVWLLAMKYKDAGREETKEIYNDVIKIALDRASTLKPFRNERD